MGAFGYSIPNTEYSINMPYTEYSIAEENGQVLYLKIRSDGQRRPLNVFHRKKLGGTPILYEK